MNNYSFAMVQPLSSFIGKIVDPVTRKRGFSTSNLIACWPDLVGSEFSQVSSPSKIIWPRNRTQAKSEPAGTLVIKIDTSQSVFFQYSIPHLIEKINMFLGYRAIAKIKLNKVIYEIERIETTSAGRNKKNVDSSSQQKLSKRLKNIDNPELKRALAQLGHNVLSK